MKLFHLVVSGSVTVFLYLVLSALWGSAGTQDLQELQEYRNRLEQSIGKLERDSQSLAADLERIKDDPGRLHVEANRIGMVSPDEIRIKLPEEIIPAVAPATAAIAEKPQSRAEARPVITGISISLGIILLLVMTIYDFEASFQRGAPTYRRRHYAGQGIRVQTASRE
jgi:cell division protein FtsB